MFIRRSQICRKWTASEDEAFISLCNTPSPALMYCRLAGADDDALVAHAVAVLERAGDDVGEDLGVAVRMHAEARAGRDDIVIDHAQRAIAHVVWVEVLAKGKAVAAVEPAELRAAALIAASFVTRGVVWSPLVGWLDLKVVVCMR